MDLALFVAISAYCYCINMGYYCVLLGSDDFKEVTCNLSVSSSGTWRTDRALLRDKKKPKSLWDELRGY